MSPSLQKTQSQDDLKALQKIWYEKLKKSGFVDIEDTNSSKQYLKSWHSIYFHCRYTPQSFEEKQEYYRRAGIFLHDHKFDSRLEKAIWSLHSEGMSIQKIGHELNLSSTNGNWKNSVPYILKKLTRIMLDTPIQVDCPCGVEDCEHRDE